MKKSVFVLNEIWRDLLWKNVDVPFRIVLCLLQLLRALWWDNVFLRLG
jgi:hypothetical protein